jgi:PKD repeat protein
MKLMQIKKFVGFWLAFCLCFIVKGQVVINEYSAANYDSFQDNYGEYEDWVEIYNASANNVDLNGWYLSDKETNLTKWKFPSSFIVPAGNSVLVYCSGRDEIVGGNAHSNFKLTQTKGNEKIILSDATGAIVIDSLTVFPNQKGDSRGRTTNGANTWSVFQIPTPGANNFGAMQEYASTPVFSQNSGYYGAPISLSITSPDPNVTIYYTTNGDFPDNTATQYTGPITVGSTQVVKAVAYSITANIPQSFIAYNTYFINSTHTIPILSISGNEVDDLLSGQPSWAVSGLEPTGTIEWFDSNGNLIDKGSGEYNKHGNDSWAYDQRGFDYIMRDQFGYNYAIKDQIFHNKSRDKFQRLIVKAAANDNFSFEDGAHIRDGYIHSLSQAADLRLDERSYVPCILYMNGEYWGVYEIREKVDDHDFTNYYYDQSKNNLQYLKTWGPTWSEYGGPAAQNDWDTFKNFVLGNPMSVQANYNQAKSQYNMGSLIDYFLVNMYVVSMDWLNWNTGWWRGMDLNGDKKKWRYTLWDLDATFGHYINYTGIPNTSPAADPCDPSSLNDPGGQGHVPIWNELLTNQEFFDDYINRWSDMKNTYFSCSHMISFLDSMINIIDPEMPGQIAKWGGGTYGDWLQNVQDLRDFINQRCSTINASFVNPCYPQLSGPYNVTVVINGIGEVKMSGINIDQNNSGWTGQYFGGVTLPFEVESGTFYYWEVDPPNTYIYDSLVDTLALSLLGNVTVTAHFIPPTEYKDVVFQVIPTGTTTTIDANGTVITAFPTTETYVLGDTIALTPTIDPLYYFSHWEAGSSIIMPNTNTEQVSFYANYPDTIRMHTTLKPTITSFIGGGDTVCANEKTLAEVVVDFAGIAPFTFVYEIDGVAQNPITTSANPYVIYTKEAGIYTLQSYSDATGVGVTSGSAIVVENIPPIAQFRISPEVLSINYPKAHFVDNSVGNIVNWLWNFGDNSFDSSIANPYHLYADSVGLYQVTLIVEDENSCKDTTFNQLWVKDEYWLYIPNAFSPDWDGINDKFCINYHAIREETFTFNIYNRIGELLYSTANIHDLDCENGWDGKHKESGEEIPMGTYIYEIYFKDFEGWKHQDVGYINLIR